MKKLLILLLFSTPAFAADVTDTVYGPQRLIMWQGGGSPTEHTFTLNDTADRFACVINPIEDATITQCCMRQGGRTGSPGSVTVGIQALDASGNPDTTYIQSTSYTPSGTFGTVCNTFTGSARTRGNRYACVWTPTGTHDGSNNWSVVDYLNNSNGLQGSYSLTKDGAGAYTKSGNFPPCWSASASRTYGQPYTAANTGTYIANGDTGALHFVIPTSSCSTAKIAGLYVCGRLNTTTSFTMLQFAGGAITDTTSSLSSTFVSAADANNTGVHTCHTYWYTGTLPTITCGSEYRVGITAPAGSAVEFKYIDVPAQADLEAYGTGISNWYYSNRTAGNWTDTKTRIPLVFPILSDMTGTGGGIKGQNTATGGAQ